MSRAEAMTPERRERLVGKLAAVSALAGRIHRGAAFDADTIACGPDSGGREHSVGYSVLEGWRHYLERLDGLVVELLADLDPERKP